MDAVQTGRGAGGNPVALDAVGVNLTYLYHVNDSPHSARLILRSVEKQVAPWNQRNLELIAQLKEMLGPAPAETETTGE